MEELLCIERKEGCMYDRMVERCQFCFDIERAGVLDILGYSCKLTK